MNIHLVKQEAPPTDSIESFVVILKEGELPEYVCPYGLKWEWDTTAENWFVVERDKDGKQQYRYFPINLWDSPEKLKTEFLGTAVKGKDAQIVSLATNF